MKVLKHTPEGRMVVHVYYLETAPHIFKGTECWCKPKVVWPKLSTDRIQVVHNEAPHGS